MPTDLAARYAEARDRFTGLVRELPPDVVDRTVPACPEWAVRDLVAHATGVAADIASGNLPAGDLAAWTAAQIEQRSGAGLPELLAEWEATGVEAAIPGLPGVLAGILVVDLVTHEHDLRAAAGRPDPDDPGVALALRGYSRMLGGRVDGAGLPALRIEAGDWSTVAGSGEPGATVSGEPYELFRALAGRRTEEQVRAFDWDGDPGPYLPILSAFGPLPAAPGG